MNSYDVIIIGAGSAGCTLAARLSEDEERQVLLLEAGGKDNSALIHMPAGLGRLFSDPKVNWCFDTEGQPELGNRSLFWPRGKVLGGSSSINGMIYIRGHARDYDLWRQSGLKGWGFSDVLPYFRRSEGNENGSDDFHGGDGPLGVSNARNSNILFEAFVEAGRQAGHPVTEDFNGPQQEGVGYYQHTIRKAKRSSAATAYLREAKKRPNLTIETNALTSRILIEGGCAVGVEYYRKGKYCTAHCRDEVVLSGGAVNSPQVLMLSGIGPADYLHRFGINVVQDLPGVGQNLQDHLDCLVQYRCLQPITLYSQLNPARAAVTGLQYLLFKKGLGATQGLESGAFLKTRPNLEMPDIQLHMVSVVMRDHGRERFEGHGFTIHICQLRPNSTGFVALKSTNPSDPPLIQPNYLKDPEDLKVLRDGTRMVREIIAQDAMTPYRGEEIWPGQEATSDEALDDWIRRTAETVYHPVGTCKMGRKDNPMAVVDTHCRVYGVEGLRVVDASVMPKLVGGNTNAPTIMIAEKISDHMRRRPFLLPQAVQVAEDYMEQAG
ncbi:MAG: choline dehydrogenase [Parvularculales bacterium]